MVMFFGTVSPSGRGWGKPSEKDEVDIRCRITNGEAEVVTKIGLTSAHNRREVSVPCTKKSMIEYARLFSAMPFHSKVSSRVTKNFVKGSLTVSLVKSIPDKFAYFEIEKITDREHEKNDLLRLHEVAENLGVELWKTHAQFIAYCDGLKSVEWPFHGTGQDEKRLRDEITRVGSARATD